MILDDFLTAMLAWAAFNTWWGRYQGRDEREYDERAAAIQDFVSCLPLPLFMELNIAHAERRRAS